MEGVRVARHSNNKVINNHVSGEPLVGGEEAYWWRMIQLTTQGAHIMPIYTARICSLAISSIILDQPNPRLVSFLHLGKKPHNLPS